MKASPEAKSAAESEPGLRMNLAQLRIFTLQLAVLFSSGVPILQSLEAIAMSDLPGLSPCSTNLMTRLERGWSLSQAMATMPDAFDETLVRLVYLGEKTGKLSSILSAVTKRYERNLDSRKKLVQATTYPAVVFLVATGMLMFLCYYMLPRFLPIFSTFGVGLPWPTRVLVSLTSHQTLVLVILAAMLAGLAYLSQSTHPKVRNVREFVVFDTPVIGSYNRANLYADMCADLALMIASGMNLATGLDLLAKQSTSVKLSTALRSTRTNMLNGESFTEALGSQTAVPPLLVSTLEAGSESGEIEKLLLSLHKVLTEEADTLRERMTGLLEPLMICFMGLVVGFVLLACFLPIYRLIATQL